MMREGKPELYFLLILYQNFFDLSNPNFSIIVNMWCPSLRSARLWGSLCRDLFGKIALWGAAAGCTGKIAYSLRVREFGPGHPPTARRKPNLLEYHITVNLAIPKIKKIREHLGSRIKAVVFATITTGNLVGGVLVGSVASGTGWVILSVFFFVFARGGHSFNYPF